MSIRGTGRKAPGPLHPAAPDGNGAGGGHNTLLAGGRSRRRPQARQRGLGKLLAAAVVVALLAAAVLAQRLLAPASYLLQIPTADASGIYAGSDVTIGGTNAGTVRSVSLAASGNAVITAAIDPAFAPVHRDATAQLRPKSLLGEMYVALDPGSAGPALPSGSALTALQVNRSTDLQQVFNTFDQPTRAKLQTLVDELGGGLAGRGSQLNEAIPAGSHDLADLAAITSTLSARDTELQSVLAALSTVTAELARSDHRQQLGVLISSTQRLMANLRGQQAQLQRAVVTADSALGDLRQGLQGTAPALSDIAATLPATVAAGNRLFAPLATGSNTLLPQLGNLIRGIQLGPSVFGGRDANGYATRISLVLGCGSVSLCSQLTGGSGLGSLPGIGSATGGLGSGQLPSAGATGPPGGSHPGGSGGGVLGFLLGGGS
jgi:virulence factor Mce-like protein